MTTKQAAPATPRKLAVRYAPYTYDLANHVIRDRATDSTLSARELCIRLEERDRLMAEREQLVAALRRCERALEVRDTEAEEYAAKSARALLAKLGAE